MTIPTPDELERVVTRTIEIATERRPDLWIGMNREEARRLARRVLAERLLQRGVPIPDRPPVPAPFLKAFEEPER